MKKIFAILAMIIGSIWMAYSFLPGLIADSRTSDWVPAIDLTVDEAKCTVHWYVLSSCDIKYHDSAQPLAQARSIGHLVYGSWGDEQFMLLRSASHPEIVTTSLGIRDLTARMVTMVLWIAIVLGMAFGFARSLLMQGGPAGASVSVPMRAPHSAPDASPASFAPRGEFGRRSRKA